MNSDRARRLYAEFSGAMAFVDVHRPNGDREIGSAFHIGDGVFVTARHVVEGNKIIEVRLTEPVAITNAEFIRNDLKLDDKAVEMSEAAYRAAGVTSPLAKHYVAPLEISAGPFLSSEEGADVAAFQVRDMHHAVPCVRLGMHWDDWIYRGLWHLSEAIILGYPPIPMVNEPVLVAAKADIHTYVQPRHSRAVHFILSAIPRGGFSGGVAIHEGGDTLGVITSSLISNGKPAELGFFTVLSIEAIVSCLGEHGLYPETQRKYHESLAGFDPGPMIKAVGDMVRGKPAR